MKRRLLSLGHYDVLSGTRKKERRKGSLEKCPYSPCLSPFRYPPLRYTKRNPPDPRTARKLPLLIPFIPKRLRHPRPTPPQTSSPRQPPPPPPPWRSGPPCPSESSWSVDASRALWRCTPNSASRAPEPPRYRIRLASGPRRSSPAPVAVRAGRNPGDSWAARWRAAAAESDIPA